MENKKPLNQFEEVHKRVRKLANTLARSKKRTLRRGRKEPKRKPSARDLTGLAHSYRCD